MTDSDPTPPELALLEALLDALPLGVVLLDRRGRVVLYNRYEEVLARRSRESVKGRAFFTEVASCTDVTALSSAFFERVESGTLDVRLDFRFDLAYLPQPRDVRIVLRSFSFGGAPYALFMIEDLASTKELERQRDSFRSLLLHDLRGDLHGIKAYARLLEEGSLGPLEAEQTSAVTTITSAAERLEDRVSETLGACQWPRRVPINLHAVLLDLLDRYRPLAAERGLSLRYSGADKGDFPEFAVAVDGDVERIDALVGNLIGNAIKHAAGRVEIDVTSEAEEAHLVVSDDGPGIPPEERKHVFAEGVRGAGASPEGSGLGLQSAYQVVISHGGRIWVDESPWGGAALHVTLPLRDLTSQPDPVSSPPGK